MIGQTFTSKLLSNRNYPALKILSTTHSPSFYIFPKSLHNEIELSKISPQTNVRKFTNSDNEIQIVNFTYCRFSWRFGKPLFLPRKYGRAPKLSGVEEVLVVWKNGRIMHSIKQKKF